MALVRVNRGQPAQDLRPVVGTANENFSALTLKR